MHARTENPCSYIAEDGDVAKCLNDPLEIRNSAAFPKKFLLIRKIPPPSTVF